METLLIVVHLLIVLALVGLILLQKSEGGGLGIGGGSGFMTARGAANTLTRATAILGGVFFATSLLLSLLARYGEKPIDILDRVPTTQQDSTTPGKGVLDQIPGSTPPAPTAPDASAPAVPTAPEAPAANAPATDGPATGGDVQPAQPQVPNQ